MPAVPARSYRDFTTLRVIVEKVVDRRVGFENPDPPEGWRWDSRTLVMDGTPETLPNPGVKKSHLLGIPREYWQNGPLDGNRGPSCKVEEVQKIFRKKRTRWAPVIKQGAFSIWRDPSYFFSDDSVVETIDPSLSLLEETTHDLSRHLRMGSPIICAIYKREEGEYIPWRWYEKRAAFTSTLDDDGNKQTTRDGDTIIWTNVDTNRREFITTLAGEYVRLIFNQDVKETITDTAAPAILDDFNDLEYLGSSTGLDNQKFYSRYFPIYDADTFHVYAVNTSGGAWTEYSVVDSFTGDNQVKVDYDLGILTFGTGSNVPSVNYAIYISYEAVPRIEYEEDGLSDQSIAIDADVNPLGQSINRGFVVLSRAEADISTIELTTTKDKYGKKSNTYGPVYIGADYAALEATVKSSSGKGVPNAEVTFKVETSPSIGGLGTSGARTTERRTNYNGKVRTAYIPPVSVESMGYYVTSVTDSNKLYVGSDADFDSVQDIYTYYVLKDDPWLGKVGADTSIGETDFTLSPINGRKAILHKWNANAINPISGYTGAYAPMRPTTISDGYKLTYPDNLEEPDPTYTGPDGTDPTDADYPGYEEGKNLAAYWVVADRYVTVRAQTYSAKHGRTIYSNPVILKVTIPEYMKGSYITSSLQEIPFGWRIKDDKYSVASAVGGATFICINPVAGPYPVVDVIAGETWDEYMIGSWAYPYPGSYPYYGYTWDGDVVDRPFAVLSIFWHVVV